VRNRCLVGNKGIPQCQKTGYPTLKKIRCAGSFLPGPRGIKSRVGSPVGRVDPLKREGAGGVRVARDEKRSQTERSGLTLV